MGEMRSGIDPGKEGFADKLLFTFKHPANIVGINASKNFKIVLQNSSQRILNRQVGAVCPTDFRPKQLIGCLDGVGIVFLDLGNQFRFANNPKRFLTHRDLASVWIEGHLSVEVDVVREHEDLLDVSFFFPDFVKKTFD